MSTKPMKPLPKAQVKVDLDELSNKEFENKYGMTKSEKKKELGL